MENSRAGPAFWLYADCVKSARMCGKVNGADVAGRICAGLGVPGSRWSRRESQGGRRFSSVPCQTRDRCGLHGFLAQCFLAQSKDAGSVEWQWPHHLRVPLRRRCQFLKAPSSDGRPFVPRGNSADRSTYFSLAASLSELARLDGHVVGDPAASCDLRGSVEGRRVAGRGRCTDPSDFGCWRKRLAVCDGSAPQLNQAHSFLGSQFSRIKISGKLARSRSLR